MLAALLATTAEQQQLLYAAPQQPTQVQNQNSSNTTTPVDLSPFPSSSSGSSQQETQTKIIIIVAVSVGFVVLSLVGALLFAMWSSRRKLKRNKDIQRLAAEAGRVRDINSNNTNNSTNATDYVDGDDHDSRSFSLSFQSSLYSPESAASSVSSDHDIVLSFTPKQLDDIVDSLHHHQQQVQMEGQQQVSSSSETTYSTSPSHTPTTVAPPPPPTFRKLSIPANLFGTTPAAINPSSSPATTNATLGDETQPRHNITTSSVTTVPPITRKSISPYLSKLVNKSLRSVKSRHSLSSFRMETSLQVPTTRTDPQPQDDSPLSPESAVFALTLRQRFKELLLSRLSASALDDEELKQKYLGLLVQLDDEEEEIDGGDQEDLRETRVSM